MRVSIALEDGTRSQPLAVSPLPSTNSPTPSPKELLYSSLATCTIATIRTFHENSKRASSMSAWSRSSLSEIAVDVKENLNDVVDPHIPQSLTMDIRLRGNNLTQAMRERLFSSASFCPVKRMLSKDMPILVQLLD